MYLITSLCSTYHLLYSHQLGSLCAHISLHCNQNSKKEQKEPKQREDWIMVNHIVNKFNLIFFQQKFINSIEAHPCFEHFGDLVSYGMKCIAYPLDEELVYHLNTKEKHKEKLRKVAERLLKSLLFEFIPADYSYGVLMIYREEK